MERLKETVNPKVRMMEKKKVRKKEKNLEINLDLETNLDLKKHSQKLMVIKMETVNLRGIKRHLNWLMEIVI